MRIAKLTKYSMALGRCELIIINKIELWVYFEIRNCPVFMLFVYVCACAVLYCINTRTQFSLIHIRMQQRMIGTYELVVCVNTEYVFTFWISFQGQ